MIEAVIFDLGNVMLDLLFEGPFWQELQALWNGERHTPRGRRFGRAYQEFSCGRLPVDAFRQVLNEVTGWELQPKEFAIAWCNLFGRRPAMEALFAEVAQVVKVGILSDTDPLHWERELSGLPFVALVKRPTLSFEVGALKPDPRMVQAATKDVETVAGACFFVDDKPENVAGARAAGLDAELYVDTDTLRRQLVDRGLGLRLRSAGS